MKNDPIVFDISEDEEEKPLSKAKVASSPTIVNEKKRKSYSATYDESEGSEREQTILKKVKQDNRASIHKSIDSFRKKKEAGFSSSKIGHIAVISDDDDDEAKSPSNDSAILISSDEEDDGIDSSVQNILNYRGKSSNSTPSPSKTKPSVNNSEEKKQKQHIQTYLKFEKKRSSRRESDSDSDGDRIVTPEKVSKILRKTREKKLLERELGDFIAGDEEEDEEDNEDENEEEYEEATDDEETEEEEYIENSQGDDLDFDPLESDDEDTHIVSLMSQFKQGNTEKELKERMKKRANKTINLSELVDVGNGWKKDSDEDYYLDGGLILDKDVYTKLYSFQKEGIKWLNSRYNASKHRGGILADEMGLGKTVQVSAFLGGLAANVIRRFLIIAPLSVLQTWASELFKWAPNIKTFVFHGLSSKDQYNSMARDFNGTLVTYTNTFASLCAKQEFDVTIVDEAHQIKNDQTGISKNLRKIGSKAKFCLTGTPIMNKLMEMWSIYDYIFYGDNILGDKKEFKTNYERSIVKSRKRDASNSEKQLGNKLSQQMRSLIQPFILRRQKNQVLESDHNVGLSTIMKKQSSGKAKISQKNELVLWCYLSKPQDNVYTQYLRSEIVRQILGKKTNRSCIFSALSTLKMLCNHPRLNNGSAQLLNKDLNEDEAFENFVSEGDDKDYLDTSGMTCKELIQESSKLQIIVKLLKEHKKTGHRTLIFSQYKTMLDIVERIITEHLKLKILRIDGTVAAKERQSRVELFQKNNAYTCFLLTTGSGGVGLTLTAADRVILIDPHWNPAVDQQAVDRAYRVGQTKNVVTYRLITVGTLEEVVYRRQVIKDGLIKNTLTKENQYRYFTSDQELLEVFTLRDKQSSETKKLLAELHPKGEIYEELGKHVKQLEDYTEIDGITWHDMLYNIESDDLNETFNYEEDAFIQQKHTITNYIKKYEEKQIVDLSSPNNNKSVKLHIKPKKGVASSSSAQPIFSMPPQMTGVPDAYLPLTPSPQVFVHGHHMPYPPYHHMPAFPYPQHPHPHPHPHPQQPGFAFQPNHAFLQQHESISQNRVPFNYYTQQPFPPQSAQRNNHVSSSIDITEDDDQTAIPHHKTKTYHRPPSNSQEEPEIIDDDDEVQEQEPISLNTENLRDLEENELTENEEPEASDENVANNKHEEPQFESQYQEPQDGTETEW